MAAAAVVGGADVVSADPEALRAVRRVGVASSWELTRAGRRLQLALAAASRAGVELPAWAVSLGDELVALATAWEALDRWVGEVGDAVAGADVVGLAPAAGPGRTVAAASVAAFVEPAPTWVDGLTDEEAEAAVFAAARQLRPFAPFLLGSQRSTVREQLAPLVRRVRRRWPAAVIGRPEACRGGRVQPKGLDDALDLLALPGPGRKPRVAGLVAGFASGFANGAGDTAGYDNLGGELARTAGHLASSVLIVGDVRDAGVEAARGNGWGVLAAAVAGVPGAGDAFKAAKSLDDVAGAAGALRKGAEIPGGLDAHDRLPKAHIASMHIGKSDEFLSDRLAAATKKRAVSTFIDREEAVRAISTALDVEAPKIATWLQTESATLVLEVPLDAPLGRVLLRGADAAIEGTHVRVVLLRHDWEHQYRVLTAFPTR